MALVAIVGSRRYPNEDQVRRFVRRLPKGTTVVSGGAAGVDWWAEDEARRLGLAVKIFKAAWTAWGPYAGKVRNAEVVAFSDEVVAFWDGSSRGTRDTIDKTLATDKHLKIFRPDDDVEPDLKVSPLVDGACKWCAIRETHGLEQPAEHRPWCAWASKFLLPENLAYFKACHHQNGLDAMLELMYEDE